jgi:hypothetical protein
LAETTTDKSGNPKKFDPALTAFKLEEPPPRFVCYFYPEGFPRQNHQKRAYLMAARFGSDHSIRKCRLLQKASDDDLQKQKTNR